MVDRFLLQHYLAQAERRVAEGERHVARHREVIAELERDGHDAKAARGVLRQFELLVANHIADRERLRGELHSE